MYIPPAFKDDIESIRATIHGARLASLVTATCPKCDHVFEMEATHSGG